MLAPKLTFLGTWHDTAGYHPPHAAAVQPATVAGAAPIDAQHPAPAAAAAPTNRWVVMYTQYLTPSPAAAAALAPAGSGAADSAVAYPDKCCQLRQHSLGYATTSSAAPLPLLTFFCVQR